MFSETLYEICVTHKTILLLSNAACTLREKSERLQRWIFKFGWSRRIFQLFHLFNFVRSDVSLCTKICSSMTRKYWSRPMYCWQNSTEYSHRFSNYQHEFSCGLWGKIRVITNRRFYRFSSRSVYFIFFAISKRIFRSYLFCFVAPLTWTRSGAATCTKWLCAKLQLEPCFERNCFRVPKSWSGWFSALPKESLHQLLLGYFRQYYVQGNCFWTEFRITGKTRAYVSQLLEKRILYQETCRIGIEKKCNRCEKNYAGRIELHTSSDLLDNSWTRQFCDFYTHRHGRWCSFFAYCWHVTFPSSNRPGNEICDVHAV